MGNLSSRKGTYVIKWYQNITKITNIIKAAQRNRFQKWCMYYSVARNNIQILSNNK